MIRWRPIAELRTTQPPEGTQILLWDGSVVVSVLFAHPNLKGGATWMSLMDDDRPTNEYTHFAQINSPEEAANQPWVDSFG